MKSIITDLEKLEQPAEPLIFLKETGIEKEEGLTIIKELKEVLEINKNILALAAPQIGINKRIFCIRFGDEIKSFINPIITKKSKYTLGFETFSSMPGKEILISRPSEIFAVYHTEDFKYEDNKMLDAAAKIFDQQIQLLDGILPNEFGLVSDVEEDGSSSDLTEEELVQIFDIYKTFIEAKTKAVKQEIATDEETKKIYSRLKFTEDVINGRTQVIANDESRKMNREERRAAQKQAKRIAARGKRK